MDANEARNLISGGWTSWASLELSSVKRAPSDYGVYIIRSIYYIPRLRGTSDILYVGEGRLINRVGKIFNYELGYRSWPYDSRPICVIKKELEIPMEFSYLLTSNKKACQRNETEILDEYEKQHLELPPVNHSRGSDSSLEY